jgi:hypothetical protein
VTNNLPPLEPALFPLLGAEFEGRMSLYQRGDPVIFSTGSGCLTAIKFTEPNRYSTASPFLAPMRFLFLSSPSLHLSHPGQRIDFV